MMILPAPLQPPRPDRKIWAWLVASTALHALVLALHIDRRAAMEEPSRRFDATLLTPPAVQGSKPPGITEPSADTASAKRSAAPTKRNDKGDPAEASRAETTTEDRAIDLEAARRTARQASARGSREAPVADRSALPMERETVLGRRMAGAAQPGCQTAYANYGILALPFLLRDSVRDGGCRW